MYCSFSALDRTGRQSRDKLLLEEHEHDEGWNCDNDHIREEQVPLRTKLADEAEQRQLGGNVL